MTSLMAMSFTDPGPDEKFRKFLQEKLEAAFPDAENVTWDKIGDYYMAKFTNSMGNISAYLNEEGGIYKVARYIECNSLPLAVQMSLNEKYDLKGKDKKILEITRENSQTYYLISFEYQNRKYIVESDLTGNLNVVKKSKV